MRTTLLGAALGTLLLWGALAIGQKPPKLKEQDELYVQGLEPEVQNVFRLLLLHAYALNPKAHVVSGRRTEAEQNRLYAQGRTAPGAIITKARGCMSWHVLGRALDLGGLTDAQMRVLGDWWKARDGKWGGDFPGLYDPMHFEYHPGARIEEFCQLPED